MPDIAPTEAVPSKAVKTAPGTTHAIQMEAAPTAVPTQTVQTNAGTAAAFTIAPVTIALALVSHTNAGKTSLLRTLLDREVGEVADRPDVTTGIDEHELVATEDARLVVLDTPGLGDSEALPARLQRRPWVAWMLREVRDRLRDPRLWREQHLARDLRKRADLVLYLVDATQAPEDAVYLRAHLDTLAWVGKPVIAILNRVGHHLEAQQDPQLVARWRAALAGHPIVRRTLELDGFSRCWVQEIALYGELAALLDEARRPACERLVRRLNDKHRERFDRAITCLGRLLADTVLDRIELPAGWFGLPGGLLGGGRKGQDEKAAVEQLTRRYLDAIRSTTDALLRIHAIPGHESGGILRDAALDLSIDRPTGVGSASLAGGIVSGALAGLGADLIAGGLTLGTGALVGAVLGATGAAALTAGFNRQKRRDRTLVRWSPASLGEAVRSAAALYLSIAHFGRGQGHWTSRENPDHWTRRLDATLLRFESRQARLWELALDDANATAVRSECEALLRAVVEEVLVKLYRDAARRALGKAD